MERTQVKTERVYDVWSKELEANYEDTVAMRRHLHQHPEPSFEEKETAAYIAEKLREYGVDELKENVGNGYGMVG